MEDNKYFLNKPEIFHFFVSRKEREVLIKTLGYHNFNFVMPDAFPRKQNCYTLHFVLSGMGYLNINNKKYQVNPHDIFFLDDKSIFSYYPDKDDPWEYIFFEVYGDFADSYGKEVGFSLNSPVKKCQKPQKIKSIFKDVFLNFKGDSPSYFSVVSSFFALLESAEIPDTKTQFFYQKNFIEEIKNLIKLKFLSKDFNLDYICSSMNISHSHLCRIFKEKENISVISYIGNLKMEKAEELLKNKNLSLKEVAIMSGFSDYDYFLRVFKNKHKVTPTSYRENF